MCSKICAVKRYHREDMQNILFYVAIVMQVINSK